MRVISYTPNDEEVKIMKTIGITRKLDQLGRIVVPKECRRELGWEENAQITICPFGRYILLKAQEDKKSAKTKTDNPIIKNIRESMQNVADSDLLLILELVQRLSESTNDSKVSE